MVNSLPLLLRQDQRGDECGMRAAPGAIRAGVESLLQESHVQPEAVDRVLIAGSFGYHLSSNSLINIGLLPKDFANKIEFLGNTSKTGRQALLTNST